MSIRAWRGLGYNRRALGLHRAAVAISGGGRRRSGRRRGAHGVARGRALHRPRRGGDRVRAARRRGRRQRPPRRRPDPGGRSVRARAGDRAGGRRRAGGRPPAGNLDARPDGHRRHDLPADSAVLPILPGPALVPPTGRDRTRAEAAPAATSAPRGPPECRPPAPPPSPSSGRRAGSAVGSSTGCGTRRPVSRPRRRRAARRPLGGGGRARPGGARPGRHRGARRGRTRSARRLRGDRVKRPVSDTSAMRRDQPLELPRQRGHAYPRATLPNQAMRAEPRSVGTARARDPLAREVRLLGALLGQVIAEQEGPAALDLVERVRGRAIAVRRRDASPDARPTSREPRHARGGGAGDARPRLQHLLPARQPGRGEGARAGPAGAAIGPPVGPPVSGSVAAAVVRLGAAGDDLDTLVAATRAAPHLPGPDRPSDRGAPPDGPPRPASRLRPARRPRRRAPHPGRGRRPAPPPARGDHRPVAHGRPSRRAADPLDEVRSAMVFFDATLFTTTPRLYRALDAALDRLAAGLPGRGRRPRRRAHRDPASARAGLPALGLVDRRRPRRPSARHRGDDAGGAPDPGRPRPARLRCRCRTAHGRPSRRGPARDRRLRRSRVACSTTRTICPETMRELEQRFPREPYRRRLGAVAERLVRTRAHLAGLPGPQGGRYERPEALVAELAELGEALAADGLGRVAHGAAAGPALAGGDVRLPPCLARGPPAQRRPPGRPRRAGRAAARLDREVEPGVTAGEVLATFRAMAVAQRRFGEAACRRYVISFTERRRGRGRRPGARPAGRRRIDPGAADLGDRPRHARPRRRAALRVGGRARPARGSILADLLREPGYRAHLRDRAAIARR